jgi:hypothetical protein
MVAEDRLHVALKVDPRRHVRRGHDGRGARGDKRN